MSHHILDGPMRSRLWFVLAFVSTGFSALRAQAVEEPPIPVMIVCPYHEDSLRRAYEAGLMPLSGDGRPTLDSASLGAIRAAEALTGQVERSFIYLYLLLGLLALISLAALRVAYRLRAELQDVRDAQRAQPLALPSPVVVDSTPLQRRPPTSPTRKSPRSRTSPARKRTRSRS